MTSVHKKRRKLDYWWLKPHSFLMFFIIPVFCLVYFYVRSENYINNVPNYFTFQTFILGILFFTVLILASYISFGIRVKNNKKKYKIVINTKFLDILAVLTIVAYIIWFRMVIVNPTLFFKIVLGTSGVASGLRGEISTIPGLTTLSQLGVVYVTLYSLIAFKKCEGNLLKRHKIYMYTIIILTIFRVIAWSERLALIEMLIPLAIVFLSSYHFNSLFIRKLVSIGPYIGILFLILIFGFFEYFRSWVAYYQYVDDSFIQFLLERLLSYYTTSLNNGAGLWENYGTQSNGFQFVLSWLYQLPYIGEHLYSSLRLNNTFYLFLSNYGNLEFNNPSGVYSVFFDLHIIGGLAFAIIFGIVVGGLYRQFYDSQGVGCVIYPIMYISLLEILRILYFAQSRAFPILLFSLIGYYLFTSKKYIEVS